MSSEVKISRVVEAKATELWSILSEFGDVHRFHPLVESSPLLGEKNTGLGAKRQCNFYNGKSIVEEVVEWNEGQSMTVDILEGDMPINNAQAVLSVEQLDVDHSEVVMTLKYDPRGGALGRVMDKVMMRSMFKRMCGKVLEGLETHVKTGADIGKKGRPVQTAKAA